MNLVEKLLHVDSSKAREKETKKIKSKKLSRLIGEEAEITIQEISGRKINNIMQIMVNKNGDKDYSKMHDMNLMYCVEGIIDPPMKDTAVMQHYGASNPKELVEILFKNESSKIADEIVKLCGLSDEAEEEVKNS